MARIDNSIDIAGIAAQPHKVRAHGGADGDLVLTDIYDTEFLRLDPEGKTVTLAAGATLDVSAGTLTGGGSGTAFTVVSITAGSSPYTVLANNVIVLADATSGPITVIASAATRQNLAIKKTDSSANSVTFDPTGSQNVEGAATAVLTTQGESISLASDGSNWSIF